MNVVLWMWMWITRPINFSLFFLSSFLLLLQNGPGKIKTSRLCLERYCCDCWVPKQCRLFRVDDATYTRWEWPPGGSICEDHSIVLLPKSSPSRERFWATACYGYRLDSEGRGGNGCHNFRSPLNSIKTVPCPELHVSFRILGTYSSILIDIQDYLSQRKQIRQSKRQ